MSDKKNEKSLAKTNDLYTRQDLLHPSFENIFGGFIDSLESIFGDIPLTFQPPHSFNEDGSMNVTIEVPGIKESDLSVSICDNQVTVRGQTKTATSSFDVEDSFTVPEGFRLEPTHTLENGILTLTFPVLREQEQKDSEILNEVSPKTKFEASVETHCPSDCCCIDH